MERVNRILNSSLFRECLRQIREAERERIYCKHDMRHFLDTARLAWIMNLERDLGLDKEIIYAASLLHDIGRAKQYACGKPHDAASAELIRRIMPECGFSPDEAEEVAAAVEGHSQSRGTAVKKNGQSSEELSVEKNGQRQDITAAVCRIQTADMRKSLGKILREADHASRSCFVCEARESCYWSEERKNLFLKG